MRPETPSPANLKTHRMFSLVKSYRPSHWHTQVVSKPLAKRGGLIDRWARFVSAPTPPSGPLWLTLELASEQSLHFPRIAQRGGCKSQDAVGEIGTVIWAGKRSLQYGLLAGNGPQNYTNFSHSILGFTPEETEDDEKRHNFSAYHNRHQQGCVSFNVWSFRQETAPWHNCAS